MVSDVVTVELRNSSSPYSLVEQTDATLNTSGVGTANYYSTSDGTPYYIVVKHRNSIETWSAEPQSFSGGVLSYNFTTAATQAYGNNLKLKEGKYCIYSGDVNGSGTINVTDINTVYAASNLGLTGYVVTDVNGSNSVNVTDINIVYGNSNLGISVQKPLPPALPTGIDWAILQWPSTGSISLGGTLDVYAQVYINGLTESSGQGAGILAWIGYSNSNSDPSTWTNWVAASYNTDAVTTMNIRRLFRV